MTLYTYKSENFNKLFEVSNNSTGRFNLDTRKLRTEFITVGQRSDYSEYLILANEK